MSSDLKSHIGNFAKWLETDTGDAVIWQKERIERIAWYRTHLARDAVRKLSRDNFAKLIKDLWATNIWKNKDYKVEQLIKENSLEKLRLSLELLLYGSDDIQKRWDEFRGSVTGLGPSSISEILSFSEPQRHALINLKPYEVLPRIGIPMKQVKDGENYAKAVEQIGIVKAQLQKNGMANVDFIVTDFFIAYLFYKVFHLQYKRKEPPPEEPREAGTAKPTVVEEKVEMSAGITGHEAAQAFLIKLGGLLGYDTYTADPSKEHGGIKLGDLATLKELPDFAGQKAMVSARKIDVVWVKGEWPECFFEVEQSTGVTPGLHRMYQVIKVDAKFFIVAPEEERKRFEREVGKAPFGDIKNKYRFRSYKELSDMYHAEVNYQQVRDAFFDEK